MTCLVGRQQATGHPTKLLLKIYDTENELKRIFRRSRFFLLLSIFSDFIAFACRRRHDIKAVLLGEIRVLIKKYVESI